MIVIAVATVPTNSYVVLNNETNIYMQQNIIAKLIAQSLQLSMEAVINTLTLLNEGCTIPFISRYRKERTGGLDEVQIAAISDYYERLKDIEKR